MTKESIGARILKDVSARYKKGEHPRLVLTAKDFERFKKIVVKGQHSTIVRRGYCMNGESQRRTRFTHLFVIIPVLRIPLPIQANVRERIQQRNVRLFDNLTLMI